MSEVKRYVLRGPADCPAPDGSQIERLLPGWQVVDAAAYDALQARVKQVVEEGRAISRLNVQQAVEIGGLQARVRELEAQLEMREQQAIVREPLIVGQQERIAQLEQQVQHYQDCDEHRQKEWQADLDRLHQAEAENAALRAELAHSREREEMH